MNKHLNDLLRRYPALEACLGDIEQAFKQLHAVFHGGGKLLLCGNGGSCADAAHIAGELMKGFMRSRPLPGDLAARLMEADPELGEAGVRKLQGALPAVVLTGSDPLATAIANDIDGELVFAQQVLGLGREGDALLAISTSGHSRNVCRAVGVARALGLRTLGLSGGDGGWLTRSCETCIVVPGSTVPEIQELHLPVYHCLCRMLEDAFFA
ncbi:SIS domain-containing protein [Ruficoccus amylovorans]|uniref:SIS domain-containing protein n=1 Tax=Ruficoccus amylovorans TaxID=1804625 RepID=A0A842HAC6_9BACT|nr:SIS domain-containing protein [Ruficoccus amylovorans]MBC2593240.1 SIS domain-containing protein [Ruficoccus amylovorans]